MEDSLSGPGPSAALTDKLLAELHAYIAADLGVRPAIGAQLCSLGLQMSPKAAARELLRLATTGSPTVR